MANGNSIIRAQAVASEVWEIPIASLSYIAGTENGETIITTCAAGRNDYSTIDSFAGTRLYRYLHNEKAANFGGWEMVRFIPLLFALCCLAEAAVAAPQDFVLHSDAGDSNDYAARILRKALELTAGTDGAFGVSLSPTISSRPRHIVLSNGDLGVTVSIFPDWNEIGDKVVPIPIAIDGGILGYRVFLIRAQDQPLFDRVGDLNGLKAFKFGALNSWVDEDIMRDAGLPTVTGSSFPGLFKMLAANRFDALNRSVTEVEKEYAGLGGLVAGVEIETGLLLYYPLPSYFWVRNTDEGRRQGDRIYRGLAMMVRDGTLQTLFQQEFGETLRKLNVGNRRLIEIPNTRRREFRAELFKPIPFEPVALPHAARPD